MTSVIFFEILCDLWIYAIVSAHKQRARHAIKKPRTVDANEKRMIKSLHELFSLELRNELCYFPGKGFIRSEHDGSAKGALYTWGGRGDQARHKKGSDIGGAKWLNAKSSGVKLWDWKYFALLFFYSESWKPRFAFDSFAGIRVNQQMETFSLSITCSFRNSGVLFPMCKYVANVRCILSLVISSFLSNYNFISVTIYLCSYSYRKLIYKT